MPDFTVVVVPMGADRFAVMLFDPMTHRMKGPDDRDDHQGYPEGEMRDLLRDRYGHTETEITERLVAANQKRGSGAWGDGAAGLRRPANDPA